MTGLKVDLKVNLAIGLMIALMVASQISFLTSLMTDGLVDLLIDKLTVTCLTGPGVDITLVSTDVEGSTELWEWVSAPHLPALLPDVRTTLCI